LGQSALPAIIPVPVASIFDLDAEDDEVEIVLNFAFDFERLESHPPTVLIAHPSPTPRLKATVCAVTRGNIAELDATALSSPSLFCCRFETIGYKEEQCGGGESVSQSPLKDKVFSTFLDKNPRFGLRPKNGISSSTKASPPNARRCHQATSEGQIAIAPLGLIAVRSGI
jgi:hypothetical protein